MKKLTNVDLQGLYQVKNYIYYIAYHPINNKFMYKILSTNTLIQGYDTMLTLGETIPKYLKPVALGWLSNDTKPSDIYPELFIYNG